MTGVSRTERRDSGLCTDGSANAAFGIQLEPVAFDASPHVVCEATGRLHRQPHRSLHDRGYTVHVGSPLRARRFAEAPGHVGRSDRIDARALAGIVEEIGGLDAGTAAVIDADPGLARRRDILVSVPGIGPMTAAALICWMPEPGTPEGGQAAALPGVAPFARDSGTLSGARRIRGGRRRPRDVMNMAAMTAVCWNPAMREMFGRLREAGKANGVALVAVMRRMVILTNVLPPDGREWSPDAPVTAPA